MKTLKPIIILFLIALNYGCEESVEQYDYERYKFVSFIDEEVSVLENVTEAYTLYLRYDGSALEEDFSVTLNIMENGAQAGVDYSIESNTVMFKAGEIRSEPFNITLIDNLLDTTEDLSLEISIESVSNPNIDIGVGIVNQSNKSILVNILDNECSEDIDIFATALTNTTAYGTHAISGSVAGNVVSLTGDLISYSPFANANLEVTLTPVQAGAKIGSASFADFDAGTDSDGYAYQFRLKEEGTYDVCTGTIKVDFWVYYESGGSWVYWYESNNTITIP